LLLFSSVALNVFKTVMTSMNILWIRNWRTLLVLVLVFQIICIPVSVCFCLYRAMLRRGRLCHGMSSVRLSGAQNLHYLKRCKIGPRLLWGTNRKSRRRFRLVPKAMTLDVLERQKPTLAEKNRFTEPTKKIEWRLTQTVSGKMILFKLIQWFYFLKI